MITRSFLAVIFAFIFMGDSTRIMADDAVDSFAKDYKRASSETDKLNLCIKAINQGLIHRGVSIKIIDQMFGTELEKYIPSNPEEKEYRAVYFAKQILPPPGSMEQAGHKGWYLAITYNSQGQIEDYHLSNLHK